MKKILVVVGTRPNFIKVTRFREVASRYPDIELKIVHTGQHYDEKMSDVFFRQFNLVPDYFLNITQGKPATQIAEIITGVSSLIEEFKPALVIVVGDVNSTMAAAIAANKIGVRLAHVESGLRSFDRSMPEEYNRIVTDDLTDIFLVTEPSGKQNLLNEGKNPAAIFMVGNTMIDSMVACRDQIASSAICGELGIHQKQYILTTIHRPSNVDTAEGLDLVTDLLMKLSQVQKIVFPVHPRTRKALEQNEMFRSLKEDGCVVLTEPLGYFDFQKLIQESSCVVTDSGGIQEETTFLGIPCLTLRPNTERPVTIDIGTNMLLPFNTAEIIHHVQSVLDGNYKRGSIPEMWDGHATERIFEVLSRQV